MSGGYDLSHGVETQLARRGGRAELWVQQAMMATIAAHDVESGALSVARGREDDQASVGRPFGSWFCFGPREAFDLQGARVHREQVKDVALVAPAKRDQIAAGDRQASGCSCL